MLVFHKLHSGPQFQSTIHTVITVDDKTVSDFKYTRRSYMGSDLKTEP